MQNIEEPKPEIKDDDVACPNCGDIPMMLRSKGLKLSSGFIVMLNSCGKCRKLIPLAIIGREDGQIQTPGRGRIQFPS